MSECYITTYTGVRFNPLEATADDIRIEDIAHALSYICRGNGQVKSFWSVAQHCINCAKEAKARGYSRKVQMACLLHDAAECYLSDVPSPLKRVMPDYKSYEKKLLEIIYAKFAGSALTPEESEQVEQVDKAMLYMDLHTLLDWDEGEPGEVSICLDYGTRPFDDVEREYLELFTKLSG